MRVTALVIFLSIFLAAGATLADTNASKPNIFETELIIAGGGPLTLAFLETQNPEHSTHYLSVFAAGRLRAPNYSSLGLELNAVVPFGLGMNIFIDALTINRVRVHIIDFGVFMNLISPVSVADVNRLFDITMGAGAEIQIYDRTRLTVDWRMFFPWPWDIIPRYGDFSRPFYDEALKGGQLWLGMSRVW